MGYLPICLQSIILQHNAELRSTLRLRDDVQYKYLRPEDEEARQGRAAEQGKLEALQLALTVLQVPPHMCEGLFKVLAAVLWLGNIQFQVRAYRSHHSISLMTNSDTTLTK